MESSAFFNRVGKVALGSRLRALSAYITAQAGEIYALYGLDFKPKWFPVFYALTERNQLTAAQLAADIGYSHQAVVKVVNELLEAGLVEQVSDPADARTHPVTLSARGEQVAEVLKVQCADVVCALEHLEAQSRLSLSAALGEFESLLTEQSLLSRVQREKALRESLSSPAQKAVPQEGRP
ncbi:MAG: MarR family transcriptional regulator [Succinivibrio sp.]|nr:MarR family transcriptional regulator [Succinivibrio sp.]